MELQLPLILFTSFLAWSAGIFGSQAILALRKTGQAAQLPALIAAVITLVAGGIAVFFHLQHWERIFNGFGHLTSGITQELICIVIVAIVMVVYFIMLRQHENQVPVWTAILALVVAVALDFVMAHSYMMGARPAWNSIWQILSIYATSFIMGPGSVAIIVAVGKAKSESEEQDEAVTSVGKQAIIGSIIGCLLIVIYLIVISQSGQVFTDMGYYFDPTQPNATPFTASELNPFAGAALAPSVVAIVCAAVAVVAAFLGRRTSNWKMWGTVMVICGLASAIALRMVFYTVGFSIFNFYGV